jgi:cytochrome c oxidase assembly protein subunit 15
MSDRTLDRLTIGRWLTVWAGMLFLLVLIGGGTRLTESGLSITEWKPVTGVLPPLTDAAWQVEFDKYKQIPQYAKMNAGMTLGAFKGIFWWEFLHRLWARLVGVVFVLPLLWFAVRRRLPTELLPRLATLGVLMGLQGAMGWYMVSSGLTARVNVSQYRLAAHLSLALVIYLLTVWNADALLAERRPPAANNGNRARAPKAALLALLGLTFLTVVSGAFVAGLRAGRIYNEFPFMGAGLVPVEYGRMSPWWRSLFEDPASAQFDHRLLAMLTLGIVLSVALAVRKQAWPRLRSRLSLVMLAVTLQVTLGITALLLAVPVALGVAHQAGALVLLTAVTLAAREARSRS